MIYLRKSFVKFIYICLSPVLIFGFYIYLLRGDPDEYEPAASLRSLDTYDYKELWNLQSDAKNKWMLHRSKLQATGYSENSKEMKTLNAKHRNFIKEISKAMEQTEKDRDVVMRNLSAFIQTKIEKLMNPSECRSSRKLFCGLFNDCGFGCELHFIAHCLLLAIESERTVLLQSSNWKITDKGWEYAFMPLSKCKDNRNMFYFPLTTNVMTLEQLEQQLEIANPVSRSLLYIPQWMEWTIPSSFYDTLTANNGDPFAWWMGQIVQYAMRPQPWLKTKIENIIEQIGFGENIVGVQIRRGDKIGTEADYHPVEEYMFYVDLWFDQIEQTKKRTVYLATDDSTVLPELKQKYPEYNFIGHTLSMKQSDISQRESEYGLQEIIIDIELLSRCDYLVCTGSSNVCRASYELMMTGRPDGSTRFQTIDFPYYFRTMNEPRQANEHHKPTHGHEIELQKGDFILDDIETRSKGYSDGMNERTKIKGKYPLHKTRELLYKHDFKIFNF